MDNLSLAGLGIGLGAVFVPATDVVMGAVPEAKAGVGSAVNDTARQIGYALGVGVIGSLLNSVYRMRISSDVGDLVSNHADLAENSVGGAFQVASLIGGPAGEALRMAATESYVYAFCIAILVASGITLATSFLALRFMPALSGGSGALGNDRTGEFKKGNLVATAEA